MTDTNKPDDSQEEKNPQDLTPEEQEKLREEKIKKRIEELRKRDPFIYR